MKAKSKVLLDEALIELHQNKIDEYTKKLSFILDLLPFNIINPISAEAASRLAIIEWELGILTSDNRIFNYIAKSNSVSPIKYFSLLLEALFSEVTKNWGKAENLWLEVSKQNWSFIDFELLSHRAMTKISFRGWYLEQNEENLTSFLSRLKFWKDKCIEYNETPELCHNYISQARFELAQYNFTKVKELLMITSDLVTKTENLFQKNLILQVTKDLQQNMTRIKNLFESENLLHEKDKVRMMNQYIQEIIKLDLLDTKKD